MSETFLQDLRFAIRAFLRVPRFTVPAVLALALGIGATSAIFSIVRGVILKPLPYRDPDRIVSIWENNVKRNRARNVIGPANYVAWGERNKSLEHLGMVGPARISLLLDGVPAEIVGFNASSGVFRALGVDAAHGRVFTPEEDLAGNDLVILLSHEFWQSRLGGRPDVLGSTIVANGRPRNVVGVMPAGFTIEGQKADFMVPYGWTLERLRAAAGRGISHGIARLRDGVTLEQAQSEMRNIAAQLEQEVPQRNTGWSVALVPIHELMVEQIRPALLVLSGAVVLVLLIACVNVANLLLARSTIRQRELGLRTALGAGRGRLVRQMLTESVVLSCAGGVAGLALAFVFHRGLLSLVANRIAIPRLDQVALDLPVLAFTAVVSIGTGLLFGLLPALTSTATAADALREGGRQGTSPRSRRVLATLVVVEVAISLVLLTGAGLLIRSFMRLQSVNPGFHAGGVLTARVQLPGTRYGDDRRSSGFYTDAVARISVLPGVQSAAAVSFLPMAGLGMATGFYRTDQPVPRPGESPTTDVRPVTPGFFRTMGIPQLAGRDFNQSDATDSPLVAIVSESVAKRQFAGEDPLGKSLAVAIGAPGRGSVTIVGVVGDVKMVSLDTETRAAIYMPHTQLAIGLMTFVVRTATAPEAAVNSVARAVHAIDPELPLADVRTMNEVVDRTMAQPKTVSVLLTAFALLALVLAGVGVYGVMAYSVSQRTQEIGVRMALGATVESVFRMILGQALRLIGLGVGIGLVAAAGLTRVLERLLFNTKALDAPTFVVTAAVLVVVATLASYIPARRGTRIAPVEALRAE
jgi:putative ABC transport system permease protein